MTGSKDEIEWFDPLRTDRHAPFIWDDGVHSVVGTELARGAICFHTACDHTFALPLLGLPLAEARCGNPVITCRECIKAYERDLARLPAAEPGYDDDSDLDPDYEVDESE